MDQEQLRRFAEVYRQMRDEQLAALLDEQSTLTDEARQALLDITAERPEVPGIRQRMIDDARTQAEEQAQRDANEAKREVPLGGLRPTLGLWLGLLIVGLVVWPLWRAVAVYSGIQVIDANGPHPFGADAWLAFKVIAIAINVSALAAAGVAIHAIHAGRTRRYLRRVVAMLWYISVGALLIQYAVMRLLLAAFYEQQEWSATPMVVNIGIIVIISSLWTAYLLLSQRCRERYPKKPGQPVLRVFE